ncbi:MAG: DsbA family protein [Hyphomicrobiaceae bacterium]
MSNLRLRATTALALAGTAAFALAFAAGPIASAQDAKPATDSFSEAQKKSIEEVVRTYLIANPQVVAEALQALDKKETEARAAAHEKFIVENKAAIFAAPTDFVFGNPKGDVTVVEFFDYNCGWCKKAVTELVELPKKDSNVRIILKELPVYGGETSVNAAKAAMASIPQGKYLEFHVALMQQKPVTNDNLYKIAQKVGLDVERLKKDMAAPAIEAALKQNIAVARTLGIEGTPGFVADTKVYPGYIPQDQLLLALTDVRKAGCKIC